MIYITKAETLRGPSLKTLVTVPQNVGTNTNNLSRIKVYLLNKAITMIHTAVIKIFHYMKIIVCINMVPFGTKGVGWQKLWTKYPNT